MSGVAPMASSTDSWTLPGTPRVYTGRALRARARLSVPGHGQARTSAERKDGPVTFPGFGEAVVDFYEGLEADNSKAYWTDNKVLYDDHVRAPMVAMLADLEPEFGP